MTIITRDKGIDAPCPGRNDPGTSRSRCGRGRTLIRPVPRRSVKPIHKQMTIRTRDKGIEAVCLGLANSA